MAKERKTIFVVSKYSDQSTEIKKELEKLGDGWVMKNMITTTSGPETHYTPERPWGFQEYVYTTAIIVEKEE